jgi:hypothetical protein
MAKMKRGTRFVEKGPKLMERSLTCKRWINLDLDYGPSIVIERVRVIFSQEGCCAARTESAVIS